MMFILCIILPPIAAAISGGFSSFFINLILTCFGWLPGIVHAIMVTNKSIVEEQNEELISTLEKNNINVLGGLVYDAARGKILFIKAPSVLIASGGLSSLYFPKTDTMRGNTGDSYALGIRAGADLIDMEQIQFLPFCLASPPSYEGLLAGEPSTASFLGVLRDKNNKVIEGNPDTIKTVNDVWKFSKNMWSQDPTWFLVDTSQK